MCNAGVGEGECGSGEAPTRGARPQSRVVGSELDMTT